jgi:hypothetical protein
LLGENRRTLHREAMVGTIPNAIARRSTKAAFSEAIVEWGHSLSPVIREILEGPQWHSDAFVDQNGAREAFQNLTSRRSDWSRGPDPLEREGWRRMRAIVYLETWLRAVFRYPRAQETMPMAEIRPTPEKDGDDVGANALTSYVPPKLTQVGNVRDLLAEVAGSADDGLVAFPSLA